MPALRPLSVPEGDAAEAIVSLLREGLELLDDERSAFLSGDFAKVPAISERKVKLLADLETLLPPAQRSAMAETLLSVLVDMSRRNEEIIQAARHGLSLARRRIRSIQQADRGVVAYDESGEHITCTADRLKSDRTA